MKHPNLNAKAIDAKRAEMSRHLLPSKSANIASGTLTEGGDVKQAPGDSLSGPTLEEGDAHD